MQIAILKVFIHLVLKINKQSLVMCTFEIIVFQMVGSLLAVFSVKASGNGTG